MAAGKHIGKVLLEMKKEDLALKEKNKATFIDALPRYSCSEDKSYVICGSKNISYHLCTAPCINIAHRFLFLFTGGLGGIGLEVIDWLVIRGARKFVISSRKGVTTGYQNWRIRMWQSYGVVIIISTDDISKEEGVESLLSTAAALAPVAAIFNLAVVSIIIIIIIIIIRGWPKINSLFINK